MGGEKERKVTVAAIQMGARTEDKEENVSEILKKIDEAGKLNPDFIVLDELSTTPYFCIDRDPKYFKWAEPVPGPTTDVVGEKARKYGCCILLPLFEKGPIEGIYYNSVAVIGPDGKVIEGELFSGEKRQTYSKVHLPELQLPTVKLDEKFFFKGGEGIAIFRTPKAVIGVLICYEKRFPEAWRTLALQGAEIAFLPANIPAWVPSDQPGAAEKSVASSGDIFHSELRAEASANIFYVVACNKGCIESFAGTKTLFIGMSCIVNPSGGVLVQASANEPAIISATIDLEEVRRTRNILQIYKDRRPELYVLWPK